MIVFYLVTGICIISLYVVTVDIIADLYYTYTEISWVAIKLLSAVWIIGAPILIVIICYKWLFEKY